MKSTVPFDKYNAFLVLYDEKEQKITGWASIDKAGYLKYKKGGKKPATKPAFLLKVRDMEPCREENDILRYNIINYLCHLNNKEKTKVDTVGDSIFTLMNNNNTSYVVIKNEESPFYNQLSQNIFVQSHGITAKFTNEARDINVKFRTPARIVDMIASDEGRTYKQMQLFVANMITNVTISVKCPFSKNLNTMGAEIVFRYNGKYDTECVGTIPAFSERMEFAMQEPGELMKDVKFWLDKVIEKMWEHIISCTSKVLSVRSIELKPSDDDLDECIVADTRMNSSASIKVCALYYMLRHGLKVDLDHVVFNTGRAGDVKMQEDRGRDILGEFMTAPQEEGPIYLKRKGTSDYYEMTVIIGSDWKACLLHGVVSWKLLTFTFHKDYWEMLKKYGNLNIKYVD